MGMSVRPTLDWTGQHDSQADLQIVIALIGSVLQKQLK